jgi:inhibitor of KinA
MPHKCNRGITFKSPIFFPLGESALIARFGEAIDPEVNAAVLALEQIVRSRTPTGVLATIPAYASLTITFDPLQTDFKQLSEQVENLAHGPYRGLQEEEQIVEVPVVYGGEDGPDLPFVATHCGLNVEDVIALHIAPTYRVHFLGFLPGFPYLGGLDERLQTPRLETHRMLVRAGSVGIAGPQTGIYPLDSPGGWRIIGRTSVKLFDPSQDPPVLLAPGDALRFLPVSKEHENNAAGD